MSNLSELLPAGGAAKEFEPVASGTLPNGTAVVLKADGTVEMISEQTISVDASASYDNGATQRQGYYGGACYHSGNNTIIISYPNSANSRYPTAAVCTISGSTITIGTPTILSSSMTALMVKCAYDAVQDKVVFFYAPQGTGYVKAATVNGNSFSFGSQVATFASHALGNRAGDMCNLDDSKVAICWGNGAAGTAGIQVVNISGTTLTVGTAKAVTGWDSYGMRMTSGKKGEILVQLGGISQLGYVAGTVSGTTVTLGNVTQFSGAAYVNDVASGFWAGHTSPESTYIAVHQHPAGTSGDSRGMVITVSGTTHTIHTELSLTADPVGYTSVGWSDVANKAILYYRSNLTSGSGFARELSYSGTTLTEGNVVTLGVGHYGNPDVTFDQSTNKSVVLYQASANSDAATVALVTPTSVNLTSTNFVGITAEAIADTATGKVNPKGGVASSVANIAPTMPFGSEYVFNAGTSIYTSMAFDPNNAKKFVAVYRDTSNSNYGTAIVGTVSGNSISYGPEVVFYSGTTAWTSIAFDPNTSGKFVVSYMDGTSGGSACVGTVSGTNITFGTAVVFETSEANYSTIAFDPSAAGKFIITYLIGISTGNAIVGTVSGTSITFGTTAVFEAAKAEFPSVSFDPNDSGKFVIAYNDGGNSDYGTAIAGTISGTTPSFGSAAVFDSVACGRTNVSFDPNTAGKFVVAYRGGSEHGNAVVGTVSGTSLSFGSNVVFNNTVTSEMAISFDSGTGGKFVIAYQDDVNSEYGTAILGVLSGTSVSFSLKTVFNTGDTLYPSIAFDPNTAGEFVVTYRDAGNSNYGTSVVGNISSALTIGSDYYLQTDGTVSTATASPAINIGRAISPTSLILR